MVRNVDYAGYERPQHRTPARSPLRKAQRVNVSKGAILLKNSARATFAVQLASFQLSRHR
jgi:hypothetical protein